MEAMESFDDFVGRKIKTMFNINSIAALSGYIVLSSCNIRSFLTRRPILLSLVFFCFFVFYLLVFVFFRFSLSFQLIVLHVFFLFFFGLFFLLFLVSLVFMFC